MKICVGDLRRLIQEVASPEAKAKNLAQTAVRAAHEYVDSVMAGKPDDERAAELKDAAPQVVSLAKWMLSHREQRAEPFAMLAKDVLDIANKSGFWKRPAFLKKDQYTDEMQAMLRRLDRSYKAAVS